MFSGGMNKDLSKSVYKEGCYIHAENFSLITDIGLSTGSLRNINGNELFLQIPGCSNVVEITNIVSGNISININGYNINVNVIDIQQLGEILKADTTLSSSGYGVAYTDTRIIIYSLLFDNQVIVPNIQVSINGGANLPDYISAIATPKIMGWGVIRDEIILFTAENYLESPLTEVGQIWKLTYDKYSFNPVITLLYNDYINLSIANPIPNPGGVVGNYETPSIKKVYWTDNYNRPRVLNIADPNGMALVPEQLEITPNVAKGIATVAALLSGGSIKTGIYQISGRLVKTSGGSSSFIIPSNPIPVINEQETTSVNFTQYEARDTAANIAKSLKGRLYNLDTEYDRVEPVILYRENPTATPDIYILPSQPIPNNGEFEFTYTGTETVIPFSVEEFLTQGIVFNTVKTMTSKNNLLFFGNVKYADFDVNFDARAYRFSGKLNSNNNQILAQLTGSNSYTIQSGSFQINGTSNTWLDIPSNEDTIQNLDAQAPDSTDNYLFQSDGQTFGGEGPNVSYEFTPMYAFNDNSINTTFRTPLDNSNIGTSAPSKAPYATVKFVTGNIRDYNFSLATNYDKLYEGAAFNNASSPYVQYGLKGYMRDEMYRFGIVFFSKKGEPSYVHWIADIRMPKMYMPSLTTALNTGTYDNRDYMAFPICGMDDGTTNLTNDFFTLNGTRKDYYGNNLGIKFTVNNLNSIRDQISGYAIVRVARTDADKTILGQGIMNPVYYAGDNGTAPYDTYNHFHYTVPSNTSWSNQGADNTATNIVYRDTMVTLASPEFLFKSPPTFSSQDEIDIIEVAQTTVSGGIQDTTTASGNGNFYKMFTHFDGAAGPKAVTSGTNQGTPIKFQQMVYMSPDSTLSSGNRTNYTLPLAWPFQFGDIYNHGWPGQIDGAGNTEYIEDNNGTRYPASIGGSRLCLGIDKTNGGNPGFDQLAVGLGLGFSNWKDLLWQDRITQNNYFYIANYRRPNTVQYGGNTYSERSYNEYISTGHVQLVDNTSTSYSSMVFGGDTVITLFDYANQLRNSEVYGKNHHSINAVNSAAVYADTRNIVLLTGVECSFPVELRKQNSLPNAAIDDGYTTTPRCAPNKSITYSDWPTFITGGITGPYTTAEWTEDFNLETDYIADNDIVKFFPLPDPLIDQTVFDVRVHRSQIKTNGELTDSWGIFKTEDYMDLDTAQGPLINLIIYQNNLVGFQEKGISLLSVNERSLTQDASGSEIVLGSGGILARYDYISRIIGSRHQFSFTTSHDAIFWFDMNTKNMYKMQGQAPTAITVAKGMSSYLSNNLTGLIQVNDNPYLDKGITATYDFRYNEAIMTFKDSIKDSTRSVDATFLGKLGIYYDFTVRSFFAWLTPGTEVLVFVKETGASYPAEIVTIPGGTLTLNIFEQPLITVTNTITLYPYSRNAFTIAYNDFIDAYTSFYSYTPSVYINDQSSIFTPNDTDNVLYRQDVGEHCKFYDQGPFASKLKLIVNESPTETKVFDNYEIVCESIENFTNRHITDDVFNRIRLYNDYQNTDFQTLPIDGNKTLAKRKERTWNISNLRNRVLYVSNNSPDIFSTTELSSPNDKDFGERMRDKYLLIDLEYDNLNNYNYIVHTFKSSFRKSPR